MIVARGINITNMCANKPKERDFFDMFDEEHAISSPSLQIELTFIMPSRALLANSCCVEVDIVARVPIHTIDQMCMVYEIIIHYDVSLYLHNTLNTQQVIIICMAYVQSRCMNMLFMGINKISII
jgi:hypothetical protein